MTNSGDAAEQVVRLSLEGTEVALRLTGSAAKNIAAALYTIYKDRDARKIKGQQKLTSMLKSGKELKVFTITDKNLKTFAKEANRYGVVYCALRGKENDADHMVDILARAEDASKINRIVERFNLSAIDSASIQQEINAEEAEKNKHKDPDDFLVDAMRGREFTLEDYEKENPTMAKTEKSHLFEPTSGIQYNNKEGTSNRKERSSIREMLHEIVRSKKQQKDESERSITSGEPKNKPETKPVQHEQPKFKKKKKYKER